MQYKNDGKSEEHYIQNRSSFLSAACGENCYY